MKTLYLLPVLLLFSFADSAAQKSTPSVLIEDFEDGNTQNSLGGYWYNYDDNKDGGKSYIKQGTWEKGLVSSGGHESKGMLHVDVVLDKGTYQWSPYYAL